MAEFNICESMLVQKHGMSQKDAQKLLTDLKRGVSPERIQDRAMRVRAMADFTAMQRANADALNMSAWLLIPIRTDSAKTSSAASNQDVPFTMQIFKSLHSSDR